MININKEKLEKIKAEIYQCKTKGDFKQKHKSSYRYLAKRRLLKEFIGHLPDPRKYESKYGKDNPNYKYHNEELIQEGNKYKTKGSFEENSPQKYKAAYRRNLLQFCDFPENASVGKPSPQRKWDKESIVTEILQQGYTTKDQFQKSSSGAFSAAKRLKIFDEVCRDMVSGYTISGPETELSNILTQQFPQSQKKRFNVKIPSKPWIKRFELDILNSPNMRAVEYDGEYHHSEKHLVKNKTERGWPMEDAKNYHPIKDSFFLNYQGIEILHIKGEDWKRDKKTCIQLSIAWLGNNCSIWPKPLILPI